MRKISKLSKSKKTAVCLGLCLVTCVAAGSAAALTLQNSVAYGDDSLQEELTVIAGKTLTNEQVNTIVNGFSSAATAKGLTTTDSVKTAREIIVYEQCGSSAYLVYNFAQNSYYSVSGNMLSAYVKDETFRKLGAPTTEEGTFKLSGRSTTATITEGTYTAQIFETGVMIKNGNTVTAYIGGVQQTADGYALHPVLDDQDIMEKDGNGFKYFGHVDGELHPLKDVDFYATDDGYVMYANYSSCCVKVEYDTQYNILNQYVYAAKNFEVNNGEYTATILPESCISYSDMVCDGSNPVDSDSLTYYKKYQSNGTAEELKQLFIDCYKTMYQSGFVAGYRCSTIKMWDLLVLDFRFGDGTTGFDDAGSGDRERMVTMVYNGTQNKVYPVYGPFFLIFKEDGSTGRKALGAPCTDILYNKTIDGITYSELQIFEHGYLFKTDSGNYQAKIGYEYDEEQNTFNAVTSPLVHAHYGEETARQEKDGVVYINYERGAIKCEPNVNKTKYLYTYYSGRLFDFTSEPYTANLLPIKDLLTYKDLTYDGAMPVDSNGKAIDFETVIKPKIYAKFVELYNQGYFCGFLEGAFRGSWNNVFAQQFIVGDSTSMIFSEERPYVSALVYNPKTDAVYLLKDDVISKWQANYSTAASPTSDPFQVEGCDYIFQTFDFGMTIQNGNLIVYTEDFESPQAYVAAMQKNLLATPTHKKKQSDGYIG